VLVVSNEKNDIRMKEKDYIESLIARSISGALSPEEFQELNDWIDESPANKKEFLALKDVWDITRIPKSNPEDQLSLFYKSQYERLRRSRMLWIRYSSAVAAILLIGLISSVFIPHSTTLQGETTQVFSVPLGSRSKVLLADGTEVNLNSGSELTYSSGFSARNRVVTLTGEGFFHVKTDKEHPFIVKTADFDVKATGTQFNVCTYTGNNYASATLTEGEIQLQINSSLQTFDVKPNEKFELARDTRKYVLETVDVESEIAWKDGQFIFRNIPFPELVQRLERWYDVKLNYSDEGFQKFAYTGRFKNQETIWQVLDALRLTSPIDYKKSTFREFTLIYKPIK